MKPSKHLPEEAITIMNEWFEKNVDNPYPNVNERFELAKNGGITEAQVKAWFSNKRNRTQNTHPKRAKRNMIKNNYLNYYHNYTTTTSSSNTMTESLNNWTIPDENSSVNKIHIADKIEKLVYERLNDETNLHSTHRLPTPPVELKTCENISDNSSERYSCPSSICYTQSFTSPTLPPLTSYSHNIPFDNLSPSSSSFYFCPLSITYDNNNFFNQFY
ncbi:unnamed protein product [Didymodactylos carnosus]|uniref:Homeobox domain-containing protein n=1 Tax=Didymodactylos carnosus TaxID=1234261 RepID=A0A8S2MYM8_9BILA|nr:unnamed protein product [Didymodactylos carnosus]CAF3978600.1 unnamed protein product [Didymodactylos carnosus]